MPRLPSSTPTEVELQILGTLWQIGPSTVRQVHDALQDQRATGYSTTLKMMQVMTEKGLLIKDDKQRPQVYRPAASEQQTQTHLVDDLIQRAFRGAADQLVLRAVRSKHLSKDEIAEIQKLLRRVERESQ
jgi:predicted transcriptional regulator